MQNVAQGSGADNNPKIEKVASVHPQQQQQQQPRAPPPPDAAGASSTPRSQSTANSSPAKSETETYSEQRQYVFDTSESEEDSVSEVESFVIDEQDNSLEAAKFLLSAQQNRTVDPLTQARIEQLLQAAGIGQLATKDGKHLADPEVLRRLTSSVSSALDEAAAALTRMRSDTYAGAAAAGGPQAPPEKTSLVEACTDGDVCTVKKLLTEGRSVHETSEEGESLLSLACSAGYYELAQVLLAMSANVEDRGIKGECTPLMEAASAGHLDIVRLLVRHGAEVNAQSTTGNTPLMYGCAGGHQDVVRFLLEKGANVEDHNENGHTPLMEAASAGHVGLAKILLMHGAGINTHSNEFKESALTLACYKGHLDMVKFLLEAGADQEHKTDEMHTALMEASMDGHVEVARLLLDSGAQVNMPTDSFESPLTLAACGGHVDLAMLLIERGANIEEVNDEGYTPLMEAAREGHEDMVALLLNQGANINAQTDETQETALTLACCGGFTEVADYLYQAGADVELGASTPLMEAAQEGHLKLVEYLLEKNANVHAQTQTGDTALTYACENGHTDVVDKLLQYGADLEHESEGGRTPLMKACRAGHHCAVQFLISKGANVHRQTTNNDHTPLSLACAGGHLNVVELLLATGADPNHKLKDNSTMLIEAAKGGHTAVVQLLLDFPRSMMLGQPSATAAAMLPGHAAHAQRMNFFQQSPDFAPAVLQEVPEAVRIVPQGEDEGGAAPDAAVAAVTAGKDAADKGAAAARASSGVNVIIDAALTTAEAQQVRSQPLTFTEFEDNDLYAATTATMEFLAKQGQASGAALVDKKTSILEYVKNRKKLPIQIAAGAADEGTQKQQILDELHRVDREFGGKPAQPGQGQGQAQQQQQQAPLPTALFSPIAVPPDESQQTPLPHRSIIDIDIQDDGMGGKRSVFPAVQDLNAFYAGVQAADLIYQTAAQNQQQQQQQQPQPPFCFSPMTATAMPPQQQQQPPPAVSQPVKIQTLASEVSQNTAISDRPKAKPVSKKEGKNVRKVYTFQQLPPPQLVQQQQQQQQQAPPQVPPVLQQPQAPSTAAVADKSLYPLDLDALAGDDVQSESLATANFLQDLHNHPLIRAAFVASPTQQQQQPPPAKKAGGALEHHVFKSKSKFGDKQHVADCLADDLQCYGVEQQGQARAHHGPSPMTTQFPESLDDSVLASLEHDHQHEGDISRVEYFAVPGHDMDLAGVQAAGGNNNGGGAGALIKASFCRGFQAQANYARAQGQALDPDPASATVVDECVAPSSCTHIGPASVAPTNHFCQVPCGGGQACVATQTQTAAAAVAVAPEKKCAKATAATPAATAADGSAKKKDRYVARAGQKKKLVDADATLAGAPYADPTSAAALCAADQASFNCMDVDSETESNHDTALTLACAGGHEELVGLLIQHGADIEHRDKKGFTPLILAATAGHEKVVELLLKHNADIEAQSERTKDTPLSLACSGGRYEVVEILLNRNANKEHRNVSDYTPLSLAASGGYVNIIKLLLHQGAEINSRTGSKLGISPLMLAAMNGHTAAVKLLLDMGSDINAQIETNRNTALTLACFQGRHEVVSLLLDRKANVEHRAKTGLTPLMEAASGGYVDVGRVLLDKGADVNATPVPSSRDTALTIAADKGHVRFVDLLLTRGAAVEVKNKKGNSPLWLAANGGHLNVVELLHGLGADIDSQDNRKVSCLMAAYRKGHVKVVKWMVNHVTQFPSDQEMIRYMTTVSEKDNDLVDKCHECIKVIRAAKETQAAKANMNASILLEELDMEKNREESKKAAAARKRERKKKKRLEKKEEKRKLFEENKRNEYYEDKPDEDDKEEEEQQPEKEEKAAPAPPPPPPPEKEVVGPVGGGAEGGDKEEGDSGIDANSQGSCSSNDVKSKEKRKDKKKKKASPPPPLLQQQQQQQQPPVSTVAPAPSAFKEKAAKPETKKEKQKTKNELRKEKLHQQAQQQQLHDAACAAAATTKSPADRDEFEPSGSDSFVTPRKRDGGGGEIRSSPSSTTSPKQSGSGGGKREEGWKEVVSGRKSSVQPAQSADSGVKKVSVPLNAISRVIGRGGSNINAIRGATGAHIEVEKQSKGQGERIITIKGSADASKQAHTLIAVLIRDPDADILQMLPKAKAPSAATTLWDKTQIGTKKVAAGKALVGGGAPQTGAQAASAKVAQVAPARSAAGAAAVAKPRLLAGVGGGGGGGAPSRAAAPPRLLAQAEKEKIGPTQRQQRLAGAPVAAPPKSGGGSTFAAKLSDLTPNVTQNQNPTLLRSDKSSVVAPRMSAAAHAQQQQQPAATATAAPVSPSTQSSPKRARPAPTSSAPPNMQHVPSQAPKAFTHAPPAAAPAELLQVVSQPCSPTPCNNAAQLMAKVDESVVGAQNMHSVQLTTAAAASTTQSVYTLFNDVEKRPMWRPDAESQKQNFAAVTGGGAGASGAPSNVKYVDQPASIATIDASKAPGYRGNAMCSPVSSKTSSNSTTPPNSYHYDKPPPPPIAPIGSNIPHNRPPSQNQEAAAAAAQANHYFDRAPHMSHAGDSVGMYKHLPPTVYGGGGGGGTSDAAAAFQPFPQAIGQHLSYTSQDSRLNPKAPDFHGKQNAPPAYNGYGGGAGGGNMFPTPIGKPNIFQQHQSTASAWAAAAAMQFNPPGGEHHHLMNGMAGMTLQHLARATDPMYEAADLVSGSPALSPKTLMHFEMQPPMGGGEEQRKPAQSIGPIGIERSRKLWQQAAGPRIPPPGQMDRGEYAPRPPPMFDYYQDAAAHLLMESSNMNMPYQSQHHQLPMPSNLGMDYNPDYKMTTWDGRSNNVDLQDKQQLGWSGVTSNSNKWSS